MSRFESALEICLERLAGGEASLEECLLSYPEFSEELRPLLKAASQVRRVADVQASPDLKQRGRARLVTYMRSHPHNQGASRIRDWTPVYRLAVSLIVLVVAVFATGTAFAQSAMPGDLLYSWKLASESAWLVVSPDPVGTDLALAERRVLEIQSSSGSARDLALHAYQQVLDRLVSLPDPAVQESIHPILAAQSRILAQAGISLPDLDQYLSPIPTPQPTIQVPLLPNTVITPALPNPTAIPTLPLELPGSGLPPILTTPTP
jgi:hypothetical protein